MQSPELAHAAPLGAWLVRTVTTLNHVVPDMSTQPVQYPAAFRMHVVREMVLPMLSACALHEVDVVNRRWTGCTMPQSQVPSESRRQARASQKLKLLALQAFAAGV